MYSNELKDLVISDTTQKYEKINQKILKSSKIYFNIMKNYSSELISIEKKINNYFYFGEIKIKELLESQHIIIKELVQIINNILYEKINNDVIKRYEEQSLDSEDPLFQKNIITNKNLKMFSNSSYSNNKSKHINKNKKESKSKKEAKNNTKKYIKNNTKNEYDNLISKKFHMQKEIIPLNIIFPKTNNEFNGALSFFNINTNKNINDFKLFENLPNNKIKLSPKKPQIKTIFSYEKKNNIEAKDKISPNLRYNNINNISYYKNRNYTIDEETINSRNNERQTSMTSNHNLDEDYGYSPEISLKKQKIKYRSGSGNLFDSDTNNKNNFSEYKNIPIKREYFVNSFPTFLDKNEEISFKKRSNTSFNFFKNNLYNENKDKNVLKKLSKNILYSVPYINNGKVNSPSKLTKKILDFSYKKLNKYNKIINTTIEE